MSVKHLYKIIKILWYKFCWDFDWDFTDEVLFWNFERDFWPMFSKCETDTKTSVFNRVFSSLENETDTTQVLVSVSKPTVSLTFQN